MKQSIISIGMTACCLSGNGQSLFAANKPAQEERPNILFILSDDHTSQSWGIYGGVLGEYARNENIRRLAAEGCVLDNCFCTNSISSPSRAREHLKYQSQRRKWRSQESTMQSSV